jgi:hypothetical protein
VINTGGAANGASCLPAGLLNSAIARGSIFRRFAPFALALLITAGAQAANVNATFTLTGTTTVNSSGAYVVGGTVTMTGVGSGGATLSGTFASTISLTNITGSTLTCFSRPVTPQVLCIVQVYTRYDLGVQEEHSGYDNDNAEGRL